MTDLWEYSPTGTLGSNIFESLFRVVSSAIASSVSLLYCVMAAVLPFCETVFCKRFSLRFNFLVSHFLFENHPVVLSMIGFLSFILKKTALSVYSLLFHSGVAE